MDKTKSIRSITEFFSIKRHKDLQKSMEPECEVHQPWEEFLMPVRVGSSMSNLHTISTIKVGKLVHPMIRKTPCGVSIPFSRNSMVRRAFEFMRLYTHFSGNSSRSVPGVPLDKIKYFLSRSLGDEL